jgi:uncharacterized protein (TIGR03435 family)
MSLGLLTPVMLCAQEQPAFEVASVKVSVVHPVRTSTGSIRPKETITPGRVSYPYVTLRALLKFAYQVKDYQIMGPTWLDSDHYDIEATFSRETSLDQVPTMLQKLVAQRFLLSSHRESKVQSLYELEMAKGAPKLEPLPPETSESLGFFAVPTAAGPTYQVKGKATMSTLADRLSILFGRPVIDMTSLGGILPIDITADLALPSVEGQNTTVTSTDIEKPLIRALAKTLGVIVSPRRGPVELLIVDHAERQPTGN